MDDSHYMQIALALAEGQLGRTWPNPSVGAVVVKDGRVVGQAATAAGGRPHAETQALAQAGPDARGATLYVTLEPCSHQGVTPPCSAAVAEAGIARVVVGCRDTNPLISGRGIGFLIDAGMTVVTGVLEQEARAVNAGFFSVVERGRPLVMVKVATSADGMIGRRGERIDITGEAAREDVQHLRARYDAVITGMGTVESDDPLLTCRLPELAGRSPVRVVIDRRGRLPLDSKLVKSAREVPLWVAGVHPRRAELEAMGVEFLSGLSLESGSFVQQTVDALTKRGITRLMVEAGAELTGAFLQAGLADLMYWYRAPGALGDGYLPAFGAADPLSLPGAGWNRIASREISSDRLDVYSCLPASLPIKA